MKMCLAAASAEVLSAALSWTSCASASLLRSTGSPSTWHVTNSLRRPHTPPPICLYVGGNRVQVAEV